MEKPRLYTAIGLMSGTSLDGIDAALLRTDGRDHVEPLAFLTRLYDESLRSALRACLNRTRDEDGHIARTERSLTLAHAEIIRDLLESSDVLADAVDLIGFHGHTITHAPHERFTWQIGDGALLARETRIPVINDFRSADVKAGGQGAPLIPLYHRARARASDLPRPIAILNIGGVANVTWIGDTETEIHAFDTGPGNALIDDAVRARTGHLYDADGQIAARGTPEAERLRRWLSHPYFAAKPPKSLDRNAWETVSVIDLPDADAIATLTAFTMSSIAAARDHVPAPPALWLVTGGGRHNAALMRGLQKTLGVPVRSVDDYGWNGDALEAEGFAYLAIRSKLGLPLSLPTTTGIPAPMSGGTLHDVR